MIAQAVQEVVADWQRIVPKIEAFIDTSDNELAVYKYHGGYYRIRFEPEVQRQLDNLQETPASMECLSEDMFTLAPDAQREIAKLIDDKSGALGPLAEHRGWSPKLTLKKEAGNVRYSRS